MTAEPTVSTSQPSVWSWLTGRPRSGLDLAAYLAVALVTIGVGIPTVMMVDGAIRLDITYHWWAWAGLPATWLPAVAAALLLRVAPGPASLVLFLSSAFGTAFFWPEYGLFTFGPVCVFAAATYAGAMRRGLFQ